MANVYLDTNFLLIPGRQKVDVFSEIQRVLPGTAAFAVVEETLRELDRLSQSPRTGGKDREAAHLGIVLAKQQHLKIVKGFGKCDKLLLLIAKKGDFVATQDKELKEKLREKGVHVLSLRQKRHVIIEN